MSEHQPDKISSLDGIEVLQVFSRHAAEPARRAVRFAAGLAKRHGGGILRQGDTGFRDSSFYDCDDAVCATDPLVWASTPGTKRIVLWAITPDEASELNRSASVNIVLVELEGWQSEATLFAASGLADLCGDSDDAPLVPKAHYGSHTIGYAVYCALCALIAAEVRFGRHDCVRVDGLAVLGWINWKAGAAGLMGRDISREGKLAEWPVIECADGHVAFLFTERDWPEIVRMIDDPALDDPRFASFAGRAKHRRIYMNIIAAWCKTRDKATLQAAFDAHSIPSTGVATIFEILNDPVLAHRGTFDTTATGKKLPRPAERVVATCPLDKARPRKEAEGGPLPLSGVKVLDLGIITAGAGVGAVLADLGATVLKIESATYPDPFRQWAGSDESPLFRFNNRNKYGLAIDLKTSEGRDTFLELAKDADIVLENFRRGVLDRLGLTFDALRQANPAILLTSISGNGHAGPGTGGTTFGSTLEANSGFSTLTRDKDSFPYITGRALNYPDQIICLYAPAVIATAVAACRRTGQGQHLDISQRDCTLYQLGDVFEAVSKGAPEHPRKVWGAISARVIDEIFTFADGMHAALSVPPGADPTVIPGLANDPAAWAAKHHAEDAISMAFEAGFGAAKAANGSEMAKALADRNAEVFVKGIKSGVVKGFPFQFHNTPMTLYADAPRVGEHNEMHDLPGIEEED